MRHTIWAVTLGFCVPATLAAQTADEFIAQLDCSIALRQFVVLENMDYHSTAELPFSSQARQNQQWQLRMEIALHSLPPEEIARRDAALDSAGTRVRDIRSIPADEAPQRMGDLAKAIEACIVIMP